MGRFEERLKIRLAEMKKAVEEKKPVIGFDFGNCNSYLCFIPHYDMTQGRLGGEVRSLIPVSESEGIPSVFFYSNNESCVNFARNNDSPLPWYGLDAVRDKATPYKNRVRLLKRHLGETLTLDDKTFSYDEAIVRVVEYCIRTANRMLKQHSVLTTNLVSLAYPVSYTCAQREKLIELVERATLEDGTKVKVFGTIAEPAAAALDYLAVCEKCDEERRVLTYDLGGGTFDLALVAAYPQGKLNAAGEQYYYDIINEYGIENLGGAEFDEQLYQLILTKVGKSLNNKKLDKVRKITEKIKKDLSRDNVIETDLDGILEDEIIITRKEFEAAIMPWIMKTIDAAKNIIEKHPNQQPDLILLTGGASQMPMIQKLLEEILPQYKGKVQIFRPSESIACGAARYGAVEMSMDPEVLEGKEGRKTSIIQKHLLYDIGIRFYVRADDNEECIFKEIEAGTPIPFSGTRKESYTHSDKQKSSKYAVWEANKENPDPYKINEDYTEIMAVTLDYEEECPKGTASEYRLSIDELGRLFIEAWDISKPDKPPLKSHVELKNLSKGGK